jgi:hypothetical protein
MYNYNKRVKNSGGPDTPDETGPIYHGVKTGSGPSDFKIGDYAELEGVDLAKRDLSSVSLAHANFRQAQLQGTVFNFCNLVGADFEGADLTGASFLCADLKRANFKNAIISRANFRDADLTDAILEHANLEKSDLTGAILAGIFAYGADITGAKLSPGALRIFELANSEVEEPQPRLLGLGKRKGNPMRIRLSDHESLYEDSTKLPAKNSFKQYGTPISARRSLERLLSEAGHSLDRENLSTLCNLTLNSDKISDLKRDTLSQYINKIEDQFEKESAEGSVSRRAAADAALRQCFIVLESVANS